MAAEQFCAGDPWSVYLTKLEGLSPDIGAIAVTDYYLTETDDKFLQYKAAGQLPGVQLLFSNIELRLDVAVKSGFVNIHLLVSPEDAEHLSEVERILERRQFYSSNDGFDWSREELINSEGVPTRPSQMTEPRFGTPKRSSRST